MNTRYCAWMVGTNEHFKPLVVENIEFSDYWIFVIRPNENASKSNLDKMRDL
jgi:hypothetical protein